MPSSCEACVYGSRVIVGKICQIRKKVKHLRQREKAYSQGTVESSYKHLKQNKLPVIYWDEHMQKKSKKKTRVTSYRKGTTFLLENVKNRGRKPG